MALVLEVVFRTVIPAAETPYYTFDHEWKLLHFSTVHQRDGLYTIGPFAEAKARWHVNNAGWNSQIDYQQTTQKPRLVIIGDSFIEALQVNPNESLAGQLRQLLPNMEVYSMGISGAPLSQYLHMARYALKYYAPSMLLLNIVHNDFDESLCAVKTPIGMLCLDVNGEQVTEQSIPAYQPNQWRRILRKSALVRWFHINLNVQALTLWTMGHTYAANVDVEAVEAQRANISTATRYVLKALKAEGRIPLLLVVDAPHRDVYAGTLKASPVRWMNELVKEQANALSIPLIDLTDAFAAQYEQDGQPFDFPHDSHWNAHGHAVAAQAIATKLRGF
jgi:lysophospholipase L1-like esterase